MMLDVGHPDYKNVTCPALAVYATANSTHTLVPFDDSLEAREKSKADTLLTVWKNFAREQMDLFENM